MNDLAPTFSKIEDGWFDGYTTSWLGYSDGLNQNDYLRFAENDLSDGRSDRHLINAVSNAKRALHIEVETLSDAYGVSAATKKFGSFPQRLAFLSKAGFFTKPRLLTKLNKLRNVVEHEYHVPTFEEAENFVDIVDLFVNAMQKHRQRYPDQIEMCQALDDTGNWHVQRTHCDLVRGELKLLILPAGTYHSPSPEYKLICISEDPDEYLRWLSCIVGQNT
jgi:uncharacterized protein YutE (UPF0331/DUF86 family)